MGSHEDRLIQSALSQSARIELNSAPPSPPPQPVVIPAEGFAALVQAKVLTAQQVFGMIFENRPPDRYRGPKDE